MEPARLQSTTSEVSREVGSSAKPASKKAEKPTRGRIQRSTSTGGSGSPRRPREVKPGGGARLLAPVALVVVALACFGVVSTSGNDDKASTSNGAAAEKSGESSTGNDSAAVENKSEPTRSVYKVKAGDSFSAIAVKFGVDANTLTELNPDVDPRALQPGQKLKLK